MLKASAQTEPSALSPTQAKIIGAALETLKSEGFSKTSARAIARAGGFNQALIFYHFGTLNDLLLAALDQTSRERMEAYQRLLESAGSVEDLVASAIDAYREDLDSGHITVLSEMIAGSLSNPQLASEIVVRLEPWIDFAQRAVERVTKDSPLLQLLPARDLAFAVVAFYLGLEVLNHLEGNRDRAEALFQLARQNLPLLGPLSGPS